MSGTGGKRSFWHMSRVEQYELLAGRPYNRLTVEEQALVVDIFNATSVQQVYKGLDKLGK